MQIENHQSKSGYMDVQLSSLELVYAGYHARMIPNAGLSMAQTMETTIPGNTAHGKTLRESTIYYI